MPEDSLLSQMKDFSEEGRKFVLTQKYFLFNENLKNYDNMTLNLLYHQCVNNFLEQAILYEEKIFLDFFSIFLFVECGKFNFSFEVLQNFVHNNFPDFCSKTSVEILVENWKKLEIFSREFARNFFIEKCKKNKFFFGTHFFSVFCWESHFLLGINQSRVFVYDETEKKEKESFELNLIENFEINENFFVIILKERNFRFESTKKEEIYHFLQKYISLL